MTNSMKGDAYQYGRGLVVLRAWEHIGMDVNGTNGHLGSSRALP